MKDFLPILIQVGIVLGFGITTLLISVLLGKSAKRTPMKDSAYECGMVPQGEAQPRFSVKFYLVAMLFILFDIEVVFLYPWGVNFTQMLKAHGTVIFWGMAGFLSLVTVGYVYAIRKGVLDWKKG
ncbi:MAG: NADH-quinone oxidoreductase subunit A [Verrucomicrobia bacterium]|nr:NADH-quinone oxidoreductase subunit A [Verrucomicrobiota bacterium]